MIKTNFEQLAVFPSAELELIRQFMDKEGFQAKQWLLGSGIEDNSLPSNEQLMSMHQFDVIYRNVYRLANRPGLGIDFGLALNLSRWGVLSSALLCANNLGHALAIANEYRAVLRSRFALRNRVETGRLVIELDRQPGMNFPVDELFALEVFMGTLNSQISQLLGRPYRFEEVTLPCRPNSLSDKAFKSVAHQVRYDGRIGKIAILERDLVRPLPLRNRATRQTCLSLCHSELERVKQAWQGDVIAAVNSLLDSSEFPLPTLEKVAQTLAISGRTLRRKLLESGTHYRELCEQKQFSAASQMLSNSEKSIKDIASLLGFSNTTGFHKAFRRWSGRTPKEFRCNTREPT